MSESERVDIYDDDGRPAGSVERAVAHREGRWHRSLHCWLVTGDGTLLVQRRAAAIRRWPGRFNVTAATCSPASRGLQRCAKSGRSSD